MPLSMKLWLALEDDVARHKAEIAQAFAQARERLLPEPATPSWPEAAKAAHYLQQLLAGDYEAQTMAQRDWLNAMMMAPQQMTRRAQGWGFWGS